MRVLVVEHHEKPTIGVIGETLHELGIDTDTVWGAHGQPLPAHHRGYRGIIILGGNMNALDDAARPYFPALTKLIREFADGGKPVLGVCLGAQLVARSFDARLEIGGELEFGFHPVQPTAAVRDDPVFGHLQSPISLFQWHTDHYALPPGAVRLVTGTRYENQVYRIGDRVYGTQFHFEATQPLVQGQLAEDPEFRRQVAGYEDWLPAQFAEHGEASKRFCRVVTRKWAALA